MAVKFIPTHCLKGESPLPVMLLREADGTAFYHDGFVNSAKMLAVMFHRIYMPIKDYGKRVRKKAPPRPDKTAKGGVAAQQRRAAALAAALASDGPMPTAKQLSNRGKKAPQQPKTPPPLGLFV